MENKTTNTNETYPRENSDNNYCAHYLNFVSDMLGEGWKILSINAAKALSDNKTPIYIYDAGQRQTYTKNLPIFVRGNRLEVRLAETKKSPFVRDGVEHLIFNLVTANNHKKGEISLSHCLPNLLHSFPLYQRIAGDEVIV